MKIYLLKIIFFILTTIFSCSLSAQTANFNNNLKSLRASNLFYEGIVYVDEAVGFGEEMISGYNFGYNTFVMRARNIRFLFDDTSDPLTHASCDWSFEINSTAIRGESYFRINDVTNGGIPFNIQSSAPTNSFYIKSGTGNIGLGTTSPQAKLHIPMAANPTITFYQDNTAYPEQHWSVYGNETCFAFEDITHSKTSFKIEAGAPDNSLVISDNGKVGIGTATPEHALDIKGDFQVESLEIGKWTFTLDKDKHELKINGISIKKEN